MGMNSWARAASTALLGGVIVVGCANTPSRQATNASVDDRPRTTKVEDAHSVEGAPHGDTVSAAVSDSDLTLRVKSALIGNPDTQTTQIDVTTENGIVLLSGFVDSNEVREQAANVARTVQGVKAIDNGLEVKAPQ
jgi:hypothetical protein